MMIPMGNVGASNGHVTQTDHLYLDIDIVDDKLEEILAVAGGYVIQIERLPDEEGKEDYRMVFEHSCTLFSYYIHLQELDDSILSETGKISLNQNSFKRIAVESGQVIGRVGDLHSYQKIKNQSNLDWAVIDTRVTLPGFIIPDHYTGEAWKIHTVDPFDYYEEPIRSELIERSYRTSEPRAGKIDFDIDGKLVGNWFLDGTENYGGKGVVGKSKAEWNAIYGRDVGDCTTEYWDQVEGRSIGLKPCSYWLGHLTFSYHNIVPDVIRISMGIFWDLEGESGPPWGVKNNAPDPASVNIKSGAVKYELLDAIEGQLYPDGEGNMVGILLVQMIDDRTIKVEASLGKSSDEVNDFSEKVRIYRR